MGRSTTVREFLARALFQRPSHGGGTAAGRVSEAPVPQAAASQVADRGCCDTDAAEDSCECGQDAGRTVAESPVAVAGPRIACPVGRATAVDDQVAGAQDAVLCDQAVFTSVRSGVGEGYRVIAVSPGVQATEKVEITRRSPSHGGLCQEDDPEAVGLEAYALPTKRHCIAFCCHAGSEHTARGGQRVYTHVVLLDRQAWRMFQANPVAVHAELAKHVQAMGPMLKPASRLEKIRLVPPMPAPDVPSIAPATGVDTVDCALTAAGDILAGRQVILREAPNPFRLLERVLLSLPMETRETLDVSVDVKFSPSRKIRLVLTAEPMGELQRRVGTSDVLIRNVSKGMPDTGQPAETFAAWEQLLRRWWREGRRQDIHRLTAELCRGVCSDTLDRIAVICEHTDAIDSLSAGELRGLVQRYEGVRLTTSAEQVLARELVEQAVARLSSIDGDGVG